jgi:protein-disulfide isomerase
MKGQHSYSPVGTRFILLTAIIAVAATSHAATLPCKAPSSEKQQELSVYVAKQYHIPATSTITVTDGGEATGSCFWKLRFQVGIPKREISLYLSPDGQYLVPALLDTTVDPFVEERRIAEELSKSLLAGDPPMRGSATARVTIVEFSDFQCPFCKRLADAIDQLPPEDRKEVRLVFHEFPLAMHPWAKDAAEVAECAALQSPEAFWKLHDYIFANQQTFKPDTARETIADFAIGNAGVNRAQFQTCIDKKLSAGPVEVDMDLGNKNTIRATPTFFVNGVRYDGAKDVNQLRAIIEDKQLMPARQAAGFSNTTATGK